MKFKVSIDCGNAAFDDGNNGTTEAARILRTLADRIEGHGTWAEVLRLYDTNGNHVGEATTTGKRKA